MKCQICGQREAVTYVKRCVDHHVSEWFVCAECAHENGFASPFDMNVHHIFDGFLTAPFFKEQKSENTRCPMCATPLRDILRDGRVGCPTCYTAFYEQLSPSIRRVHGNVSHNGKVSPYNQRSSERELTDLKAELAEAIKRQEYECCAALRDRIRELEGGAL